MATKLSETTRIAYKSTVNDIEMNYLISLEGSERPSNIYATLRRGEARLGSITQDSHGTLNMNLSSSISEEDAATILATFFSDAKQIKADLTPAP